MQLNGISEFWFLMQWMFRLKSDCLRRLKSLNYNYSKIVLHVIRLSETADISSVTYHMQGPTPSTHERKGIYFCV